MQHQSTARSSPRHPRSYRSHVIFDDTLHPQWNTSTSNHATIKHEPGSSSHASSSCDRFLRLSLPTNAHAIFRAAMPIKLQHSTLSFWSKSNMLSPERCDTLGQFLRPGWFCAAAVCISLRQSTSPTTKFLPLCTFGLSLSNGWSKVIVPASAFASETGKHFDEVIVLTGQGSIDLHLDEVVLLSASTRPSLPSPPPKPEPSLSYSSGCKYLASHTRHRSSTLPTCRVSNGDHLSGEWIQTCHPDAIRRPDKFAYGQALGRTIGNWDYRLCFQQGFVERERSRLALSYSWRPKHCTLQAVDGARFSKSLGQRTMLFWGDSLTAQHFYSLVLLLGNDVIQSIRDVSVNGSRPDAAMATIRASRRVTACDASTSSSCSMCDYTGLGNEGGAYTEVELRDGGRILKVLGHAEMADQMSTRGWTHAWWRHLWEESDVIVFNPVGHHLRTIDASFASYPKRVADYLEAMAAHTKKSASIILRISNLGHHECEKQLKPLASQREAWKALGGYGWKPLPDFKPAYFGQERRKKGGSGVVADKYDWRAPVLYESEWKKQLASHKKRNGGWFGASSNTPLASLAKRFAVLNVSHVDRRADGHVGNAMRYSHDPLKRQAGQDCLHYCFPGPADSWAVALYNLLMASSAKKPVRLGS